MINLFILFSKPLKRARIFGFCLLLLLTLLLPLEITANSSMLLEQKEISLHKQKKDGADEAPAPLKLNVMIHRSDVVFSPGIIIRAPFTENAQGTLHIFSEEQIAYLELLSLQISRDLVFIDKKGAVSEIFPHIEPGAAEPVVSEELVKALLQLNAGDVQKYDIKVGDSVFWN